VNLLFSLNDSYLFHCLVALNSALKQLPKELEVNVYLFSLSLSRDSLQVLNQLCVSRSNTFLHPIAIQRCDLHAFPMPPAKDIAHISLETYFRLFAAKYLPSSLEKIIYLDSDIIVRDSLVALWDVNLERYPLAAVFQFDRPVEEYCKRLKIDPENGYFNAGVLVINLDMWRRENVLADFRDTAIALGDSIHFHDQDILNKYFCNRVLPLCVRWNIMPFFFSKYTLNLIKSGINSKFNKLPSYPLRATLADIASPSIIHFASAAKPWDLVFPGIFSYLYWHERTQIEDYQLSPSLRLFCFASKIRTLISLLNIKMRFLLSYFLQAK
jgi:lipopolysaccharide biosynthesis glycosyltransferase